MNSLPSDVVFVGIKGAVLALDRGTGTERWSTSLKGSDYVGLVAEGGQIYATSKGRVYCLDGYTGTILWENGLPGRGYGIASLLSASGISSSDPAALAEARRRAAAAASAG